MEVVQCASNRCLQLYLPWRRFENLFDINVASRRLERWHCTMPTCEFAVAKLQHDPFKR